MKIRTDEGLIDVDAPVLPAYELKVDGCTRYVAWCRYCREWHRHGPAEGHREAHCNGPSPYHASGYNLALRGPITVSAMRWLAEQRRAE